jgi:hypothetical protein
MSEDSEKILGESLHAMAQDIKERDAEIERLRGAYEQQRKDCINLTEKVIPNLREEIERLRADRDSWADQADARVKDCVEYISEIERLRSLLSLWLDMIRLFREGKPVPLDFIEAQIQEALKDSKTQKICNWTPEGGDYWETDCGNAFCFIDGGPSHNSMVFCPYCGNKLVEVPEEDGEDS